MTNIPHRDDEPKEEPVEPLGPRALEIALRHAYERFGGDPFAPDAQPEDDPWGPLAAESRAETDRFWDTVGDRRHAPKKDTDD